jgi:hypothetical protein
MKKSDWPSATCTTLHVCYPVARSSGAVVTLKELLCFQTPINLIADGLLAVPMSSILHMLLPRPETATVINRGTPPLSRLQYALSPFYPSLVATGRQICSTSNM